MFEDHDSQHVPTDRVIMAAGTAMGISVARATIQSRYSFTVEYLVGATIFARDARSIEHRDAANLGDTDRSRHRACVVSAIMQSAAALEAETWEVCAYGPGHHLGSNGTDHHAQRLLKRLVRKRKSAMKRSEVILQTLKKKPLEHTASSWTNAELLVELRNALVHYKSRWDSELQREKPLRDLAMLGHRKPSFLPATGMEFFPHYCLSADCASWAVNSAVAFLGEFYDHLGVPSPLPSDRQVINPNVQ